MKAIEAKDLKVGELYYDTEFMDDISTVLKFEKMDDNTLYFTHDSGIPSYIINNGYISFSITEIFYQP